MITPNSQPTSISFSAIPFDSPTDLEASNAAQQAIAAVDHQLLGGTLPCQQMAAMVRMFNNLGNEEAGGQTEIDMTHLTHVYLDSGQMPSGIALPTPSNTAPTRIERAVALLESCQAALSGPADNLAAVGGRTGVIVAMSVALRETIAYYVQQALDSNDVSEANRAWATAGVFMVGPCLNLLGLVREEWQGSANLRSRLGRLSMLGLTLGTGIAVGLQGGLARMTTSTVSTTLYALMRDVMNTFFPLNSNVTEFNLLPTAAAAGLTGVFGGMLEWLAPYLPGSGQTGSGGAAQGLDYDLFGTLLHSLTTVCGAIQDDLTLLGLNFHGTAPPGAGRGIGDTRWQPLASIERYRQCRDHQRGAAR